MAEPPEMTQIEYDALFAVNGMAYKLRDEFVSVDTLNAQDDYNKARRSLGPNHVNTKHAARQLEERQRRDVENALRQYRQRQERENVKVSRG